MRAPDFIIGNPENPYLKRWWLIPRNRFFNVYLHQILRSDDDRALHDHPWWNVSVIFKGGYWEHILLRDKDRTVLEHCFGIDATRNKTRILWRGRFAVIFRRATSAHRLELDRLGWSPEHCGSEDACWSLFITGPRIREWGFYCPQGWKHWKLFTAPGRPGQIGPGCND